MPGAGRGETLWLERTGVDVATVAVPSASEPFRAFPRFNAADFASFTGSVSRLKPSNCEHFSSDSLADRLVRALAEQRAIPIKEALESFEFFTRVRRRVASRRMADLMCGHGLTGMLFAACCEEVEDVVLVDRRRPPSHDAARAAVVAVAPWAADKIRFEQDVAAKAWPRLAKGTAVIGVHACGQRTDLCIDAALALEGALAVMPCCYGKTPPAPAAVRRALGAMLAWDVHRTYRLEAAGRRVRWACIPAAVTPMNRILMAAAPPE